MCASVLQKEDDRLAALVAAAELEFGPCDIRSADRLSELGWRRMSERRYGDAIRVYERAVEIVRSADEPSPSRIAQALRDLGEAYHLAGKWDSAEVAFKKALEILRDVHGYPYLLRSILESFLAMETTAGREEQRKILADQVEVVNEVVDGYHRVSRRFRSRTPAAIKKAAILVIAWVMALISLDLRGSWLQVSILSVAAGLCYVVLEYVGKGISYRLTKENIDSLWWDGGKSRGVKQESRLSVVFP